MLLLSCGEVGDSNQNKDFTDSRNGKTYKIVTIGNQTWMAENLNFNASGSACYNNDPVNCETYGRLYDWAIAMNLPSSCNSSICADQVQSNHQGICPTGWHLPSSDEWNVLIDAVGGRLIGGKNLKATSGWDNYEGESGNGLDRYGFTALPGGLAVLPGDLEVLLDDYFGSIGSTGLWWSTTEDNYSEDSYVVHTQVIYNLFDFTSYGGSNSYGKTFSLSVRCIKN